MFFLPAQQWCCLCLTCGPYEWQQGNMPALGASEDESFGKNGWNCFLCFQQQVEVIQAEVNSVQFSSSVVSNSWQPLGLQHASLPCPSPTPRACSNSCPLGHCSIQPSHPLPPPSPPALSLSQHQGLFQWIGSLHQMVKYWSFSISPSNE